MLNDDGHEAYPSEDAKTEKRCERILGHLTWSSNIALVSFPEVENPRGDSYVVLVSPNGNVLRESLPVDVEYNAKTEWTDDTHFQIKASKPTFKFAVEGGKLREVAEPALH